MAEPKSFPALAKLLDVCAHEDRPLSYREDYFSLIVKARAELEKARELLRTSENHKEHLEVGANDVTQQEWEEAIAACRERS
jgi:hypothetical protein